MAISTDHKHKGPQGRASAVTFVVKAGSDDRAAEGSR